MRALLCSVGFLLLGSANVFACPDWTLSGQAFELSGLELFREQTFPVTAGGDIQLQTCGNIDFGGTTGAGYVTSRPDFTFSLTDLSGYRLVLMLRSECDSILLVNTADASWRYDDDSGGNLDARIDLSDESQGAFDIWVGTHDGEVCEAILSMETFRK